MPITVVCTGCRKRFSVSEKFAGKKGPCPKCKTVIQIPAADEEIQIHAPETEGPKTATGQAVFEPIKREDTSYSPVFLGGSILVALAIPLVAWMMRSEDGNVSSMLLAIGALVVAFPVTWCGYSFLRDDELEAYRGKSLWSRISICSLVYAVLWAVYAIVVKDYVFGGEVPVGPQLLFVVPPFVIFGALTAFATFDLDFTLAGVHYGFYLAVTIVLRLIMGMTHM